MENKANNHESYVAVKVDYLKLVLVEFDDNFDNVKHKNVWVALDTQPRRAHKRLIQIHGLDLTDGPSPTSQQSDLTL